MRAQRISAEEQYRLIMECRASGLTDYQWCMEHDIKPSTFYNWVKRLRKSGSASIPERTGMQTAVHTQEIVKVELSRPAELTAKDRSFFIPTDCEGICGEQAMEVLLPAGTLRIPNGTDPVLLEQVMRLIGWLPC